mgnify:CR=1 FL=1
MVMGLALVVNRQRPGPHFGRALRRLDLAIAQIVLHFLQRRPPGGMRFAGTMVNAGRSYGATESAIS